MSRMPFVRAYPRETQDMVFDAHDRAFAFFKGTCTRRIRDYVPGHISRVRLSDRALSLKQCASDGRSSLNQFAPKTCLDCASGRTSLRAATAMCHEPTCG